MWNRNSMLTIAQKHIMDYPTPVTLTWSWSWGSLAGLFLVVQIVSGCYLAMHYDAGNPYETTMNIVRDVPGGMWTRFFHQNGASAFFLALYIHMWRTFRYGSYVEPRNRLWDLGMAIYILGMAVAFLGYVLPWGQMSFWGATVITKLISIIPFVGQDLVHWLWGGYYVGKPTLHRFYSLHYLAPMAILGLIVAHLGILHKDGSSNPLQLPSWALQVKFGPYYGWKDVVGFFAAGISFVLVVTYLPSFFGYTSHPDNYIEANPMATPAHIVPEWYFLWVYAILRSCPSKLGGVAYVAVIIFSLWLLPRFDGHPAFAGIGLACFFILTWIGAQPLTQTVADIGYATTIVMWIWLMVIHIADILRWSEEVKLQHKHITTKYSLLPLIYSHFKNLLKKN